jgi:hypothetical protein
MPLARNDGARSPRRGMATAPSVATKSGEELKATTRELEDAVNRAADAQTSHNQRR